MRLAIITAHAGADCADECLGSWGSAVSVTDGREGMLAAYQKGFEQEPADVLMFVHDDVICREPTWRGRVMAEFADPTVGLVGFGGAIQHGSFDLYKTPYRLQQLGRSGYLSNVDDAEVHGQRFAYECDVAVLDGFALIARRSILERAGGWPLGTPIGYSLYDYWLSCETRRQGYRIRLVGIRAHHWGGRTAVALKMADGQGPAHDAAHRYIYDTCRDVLPFSVVNQRDPQIASQLNME